MRYITPFHYLPSETIQDLITDVSKIKLVRKRMLAEVELSDTQSIFINGKELTKFDVINIFDNLNNQSLLDIHSEIFKDKALLDFLENGKFSTNFTAPFNPRLTNEIAINLISPHYIEVSIDFLNEALAKKDIETVRNFFSVSHLMNNKDTFEFYEYLTKKLMVLVKPISELEEKIKNNYIPVANDLNELHLGTLIKFLNELPEDFNKLREDVAASLNGLGCELINHSYNAFAVSLFTKAQFLKCSDFIKDYFDSNLSTAKGNLRINSKSSTSNSGNSRGVLTGAGFLVFIVIRIILAISNSSSHADYTPVNYTTYVTTSNDSDYTVRYNSSESDTFATLASTESTYSSAYYKQANTSFDDFMRLLYNQNLMFSPRERIYKSFKKGDNVYKSLFAITAFTVSPTRKINGNVSSNKTKTVRFINKTDYECILISRNTIQSIPVDITSIYVPAKGSIDVKLKDGYHDIRPYMGNKLIKNEFYNAASASDNGVSYDFIPEYLFEIVPRKNDLLKGIGIEYEEIKNTDASVILQDNTGVLESDITGLKK